MQEGGGGSQYVVPVPEVTLFTAAGMGARADQLLGMPAGASDQRQPSQQPQQRPGSFEEQRRPMRREAVDLDALAVPEEPSEGEFRDEDAAVLADVAAGEEAERAAAGNGGGGGGGNRWPPEETMALLRIRSEMDAAFRDASLKGPLWEDVSRKLAELGYKRSAKKCREKFENVHKYYKRTREGRAGRQDGKSYKFFTQLEALNARSGGGGGGSPATATIPATAAIGMVGSAGKLQPTPLNAIPLSVGAVDVAPPVAGAGSPAVSHPSGGASFSSNNSSSASGSSEEGHAGEPRKRKRAGRDGGGEVGVGLDSGGGERRKMVAFFEGLMRQVVERQEAMQQKLLEMIEKREQDRMIREEAWRRQEMARLTREHEAMAQEREIAAARDATIIAFLHKVTGQTVPTPILPAVVPAYPVAAQPLSQLQQAPPPGGHQPQAQQQQRHSSYRHGNEVVRTRPASPQQVLAVAPSTDEQEAAGAAAGAADPASSRWPKSEVFALIKLRSEMEIKYQEAGPKGPLWEEIAAGMRRMGYSRSAKRCKEKWENINKYFKKVKDISKKRPEDAKTCPYFHELDALYRRKVLISGAGASLGNNHVAKRKSEGIPCPAASDTASQLALLQQSYQAEAEAKSHGDGGHMNNGSTSSSIKPADGNGALTEQARHRNGGTAQDEGISSDGTSKEPEDAVRGPADRRQHATMVDYDKMEETESDSMDLQEDDDDVEEDEEKTEMEYRVEYHQRPAGVNGAGTASNGTAAGGNSFMAMVQ